MKNLAQIVFFVLSHLPHPMAKWPVSGKKKGHLHMFALLLHILSEVVHMFALSTLICVGV